MAFKLNEKTLEPHNGDYIAFLKEIEKGNAKVSGLTVDVHSDLPCRVTGLRATVALTNPIRPPPRPVSSPRTRTPCLRYCVLRAA